MEILSIVALSISALSLAGVAGQFIYNKLKKKEDGSGGLKLKFWSSCCNRDSHMHRGSNDVTIDSSHITT